MKALLIDPEQQTIEAVDIEGRDDIARLIGYDTLESDEIGPDGDRLFFDEECFLRGTTGRFQIDSVIPVSGKGLVVGSDDDGATLKDVASDLESIRGRMKYL
ncbi:MULTISPECIES: hypothetical protein [unclassified Thioalkalivibrio]|uniref:hypothetical protein n=1 Tax=unclassified Thioalkalivibrio TaxID=2621013 RepID=UPI00037AD78C|nr:MULTISPECIES: hypothetical protein [unclassified Thioalkalivibrio]